MTCDHETATKPSRYFAHDEATFAVRREIAAKKTKQEILQTYRPVKYK